ncbi:MAG: hypothetical protein LBJ64_06795 [Deltaproteobacteria bacterium]|jgi:hypothetical protein|nr:hypothetical protein [Deltaproteobacteria bacterium]
MRPFDMVRLSPEHLKELNEVVARGPKRSKKVLLAMALIWLDCAQNGPAKSDSYVANALGLSLPTLGELKKTYHLGGPQMAVELAGSAKRKSPGRLPRIDVSFEGKLMELASSAAPDGKARWSVRLLAEKAVENNIINSVSHMTVYRLLKKNNHELVNPYQ